VSKVVYHVIDLTSENRRKLLLEDDNKNTLIKLISNNFKKPMLRIFVREEYIEKITGSLANFKFYIYESDEEFKMGDFYLQVEELGDL
jgi:archaeosine-15-forming tRNA-guanine transglycosylase